jgi:hypothetical protein
MRGGSRLPRCAATTRRAHSEIRVITQAGLADTWAEEHKNALVAGFASGYSEFIFIAVDALLFYVGALMVDAGTVDFKVCDFLLPPAQRMETAASRNARVWHGAAETGA